MRGMRRVRGCVSGWVGVAMLAAIPSAHAAAGDLDGSFGTGGIAVSGAAEVGYEVRVNGLAVQADDKVVLVGTSFAPKNQWIVLRYRTDGTLDPAFGGGDGYVTLFGTAGHDGGMAVAVQPDGRLIVAGSRSRPVSGKKSKPGHDFAVVRLLTDGTFDTSFGTGGVATVSLKTGSTSDSLVADAALMSDGRIVVGGHFFNGNTRYYGLARFTASGALDGTFGSGGKATFDLSSNTDEIRALDVDASGRILTLGEESAMPVLRRFTTAGTLDASHPAVNLYAALGGSWLSVLVDPAGGTMVSGTWQGEAAIARYTASGVLDTGYGIGGVAQSGIASYGRQVVVQPDGMAVLVANAFSGSDFVAHLVRFDASGTLDSGFGVGGWSQGALASGTPRLWAFQPALDSSGRILVGAWTSNAAGTGQRYPAVVRYLP